MLEDLADFKQKECDLIVEVAHPSITEQHGADFLSHCDYMVGSPTALSNAELEAKLREVATSCFFTAISVFSILRIIS